MRLAELEEMMNEEPDDAEAAIAELVSSSNIAELVHIAEDGRTGPLKLRAVEALADVGGAAAEAALVELLESANRPFLEGGSEQRREHEAMQARLVQSLARTRGVPAPAGRTPREIAEFIKSSRRR